ncbi:MAG: DUF6106 family protein [Oscillospiraceae bacterium]
MEIFKEQLIRKYPDSKDQIKKVLIVVAAVILAALLFFFSWGSPFAIFGIVLAGLVLYGAYFLLTNLMVEYEYILTNGELDIDKIMGQRTRKRLATLNIAKAEEFGEAGDNLTVRENETFIKADANNPQMKNYYVRVNHKTLGNTILLFTPSEEMLEEVKKALPRTLQYRL